MGRELDRALRRDQRAAADLRARRHRARPRDPRADRSADRARPRLPGRGRLRRRVLRRPLLAVVRRADAAEDRRHGGGRGRRSPWQARPARLRALEGLEEGTRAETAAWPSPYGPGRPGWHIECSAMAAKYLGPAFDIHGGGVDLRFPHHENELAQSRAAGQAFASYWLHNAWITTAGEKMSKSLGNSLLVPEVLKRVRGIELRFYMVSAHYRSHVEFSLRGPRRGRQSFRRIEAFLDRARPSSVGRPSSVEVPSSVERSSLVERSRDHLPEAFVAAIDDDLGTPAAVAVLHEQRPRGQPSPRGGRVGRRRGSRRRGDARRARPEPRRPGVRPPDRRRRREAERRRRRAGGRAARGARDGPSRRDWARADAIRDRITAAGIEVEDTPDGPTWTVR